MAETPSEREKATDEAGKSDGQTPSQTPADTAPKQNEPSACRRDNPQKKWWCTNDVPMLLVTFFGLLAVIAYTCVTHQQVTLMQGTLDEMRAEQRPWIPEPDVETYRMPGTNPTVYGVRLTFTNVGKTPSIGFWVDYRVVENTIWPPTQKGICNIGKSMSDATLGVFSVAPGSHFSIIQTGSKPLTFTEQWIEQQRINYPVVIGCAIYGSPFDKKRHQTGFVAPLDRGNKFVVQWVWEISPD